MKAPPAFQFYASDLMADKRYRLMSLAQRGLYISMLCECWVNRAVPSNKSELAKMLGITSEEVVVNLTAAVQSYFEQHAGELINSELESYRQALVQRREKMSQGGQKGARTKWKQEGQRTQVNSHPNSEVDKGGNGHPNEVSMGPRVERKRVEARRGESIEKGVVDDSFVSAYTSAEFAHEDW